MASSPSNKYRIILDKPEHWDGWISFLRTTVQDPYLWALVDPDSPVKPNRTPYPEEPMRPGVDANGIYDPLELHQYKTLRMFREKDLNTYNYENKALHNISKLIFETTSTRMINQVAYSDPDPWSKLVALKQRLKPTDQSRTLLVEKRYHQLARGPVNQTIEAWLDEWSDMYHEGVRMGLSEVSGDRAIRDFLLAIQTADSIYANSRQQLRSSIDEQNHDLVRKVRQRTMDEEVEKFRNHIRLQNTTSAVKDARTTLASDTGQPTLKGENQQEKDVKGKGKVETPTCVCGEKMWYSDCPYLVPSKAPSGWKEDPATRTKVNDALKDTKTLGQVKKSLERAKTIQNPNTSADVLTTTYTTLAADVPGIESFLIHDGGSNAHVCNSKSAHLYTKLREAHSDEYLNSGTGRIKVESWGQMKTAFESPTGLIPVIIQNVAFVGSFITSLISQSILDAKGIHFDTGGPRLYKDNITKYQLYRTGGHYTFTAAGPPHPYPQNASKRLTTTSTTLTSSLATPSVKFNNVAPAQAILYNCATSTSAKKAFTHIASTSLTSPMSSTPSAFTSTKPSYVEGARRRSFKSPKTPNRTPSTSTSTRRRTSSPMGWYTKPRTLIKPVPYMTMEDLFRKFDGKHLAPLKTKTSSPPDTAPAVTSSKFGIFSAQDQFRKEILYQNAAISASTSHRHANHAPSSTKFSKDVLSKFTTARRALSTPIWEWTRGFGLRLGSWYPAFALSHKS